MADPVDAELKAQYAALSTEIASAWWAMVPKSLQVTLLKRADLPVDSDIRALNRYERWKIAHAAELLIAALEPATRVRA